MSVVARGAAGVLAVALIWPVQVGVVLTWLMFALVDIPSALAYAAATVALLYVVIALGQFALKGARPKLLRVWRLAEALTAALGASAAFTLVIVLGV